jgi:hypothetical protein
MWFSADNLVLVAAQSACVALPAAGVPIWAERFRSRGWALVAPLSIVLVVAGIEVVPSTADVLTWVALLLVPVGCALALGWAMHGGWTPLALLAAPLLALAWALPESRAGQLATIALIAGSAVTVGRLLAGAAPLTLLKAGVLAMAAVDAWLVFTNRLQPANAVLVTAVPAHGLPQLQSASFGGAGLGYGDFFVAALVGGILAMQAGPQAAAAAAALVASLLWDQLFLVYDVLPATIPPAVALLVFEALRRAPGRGGTRLRRAGRAGDRPPRTGGRAATSPRSPSDARRGAAARAPDARRHPRTSRA